LNINQLSLIISRKTSIPEKDPSPKNSSPGTVAISNLRWTVKREADSKVTLTPLYRMVGKPVTMTIVGQIIDHQEPELNACCLVMYINCYLTGQMW
jgi:hypothetical protein